MYLLVLGPRCEWRSGSAVGVWSRPPPTMKGSPEEDAGRRSRPHCNLPCDRALLGSMLGSDVRELVTLGRQLGSSCTLIQNGYLTRRARLAPGFLLLLQFSSSPPLPKAPPLHCSAPRVARDRGKARGDVFGVLDLWAG